MVTAEGDATLLEEASSPPLAATLDEITRPKAEVPFPPGATLLLYTDGLVERRGRTIDDGFAELAGAVRRHLALDMERLADAVLAELRDDGPAPDDTALVVARSTG